MKYFGVLLILISLSAYPSQSTLDNVTIVTMDMRTIGYSDPKASDLSLITFDKAFTNTGVCDGSVAYLKPTEDAAIFSALLKIKLSNTAIKRVFIDKNLTYDSWCKLVAIAF